MFKALQIVSLFLISYGKAETVDQCTFAKVLRSQQIPEDQIGTYMCIVSHTTNYNTDGASSNSSSGPDSGNGIFSISKYWCSSDGDNRGKGCIGTCSSYSDIRITDDVHCANTIHQYFEKTQGDGFKAWSPTYAKYCSGDNSNLYNKCKRSNSNTTVRTTVTIS